MSGLLSRLAKGLSTGVETYATMELEEARANRKAKLQQQLQADEQKFKVSERKAREEFDLKKLSMRTSESADIRNVEYEKNGDENTGSYTYTKGGKQFRYDAETDTVTELGKGTARSLKADDDTLREAEKYAEERADTMAGYLSTDKEDFKKFEGSRELAKRAFKQEYLEAEKAGTLSKLLRGESSTTSADTADADIEAPISAKESVRGKQTTNQSEAMVDEILQKFSDQMDEESILREISRDKRMPPAAREIASKRLHDRMKTGTITR
jgi:hypothetical protein